MKRYEREAVNYFDSPERYHDTNNQASAALFFSKIFRKKKVTATFTKTVTNIKISYADPTTIYKTLKPSGIVNGISETDNTFIYESSTQNPSKTRAPFSDNEGKDGMSDYYNGRKFKNPVWEPEKPEDIESLIQPEESKNTEESGEPESKEYESLEDAQDFFEFEPKEPNTYLMSKKTHWPKTKTSIVSDLSDTLPTKLYKATLKFKGTEQVNETPSITFSFEQSETGIVSPVESRFYDERSSESAKNLHEDGDYNKEDEFHSTEKDAESTSLKTHRVYNTHFYSSANVPFTTDKPKNIDHSSYMTRNQGPYLTGKGPEPVYSHHTTKFLADDKEKEVTDDTIENQLENENHSASNSAITDTPKFSGVTTHTKYHSYKFLFRINTNLKKSDVKILSHEKLFDKIKKMGSSKNLATDIKKSEFLVQGIYN